MSRSVFSELKGKMIDSGSKLNLFLGINIAVFLMLGIFTGLESILFSRSAPMANFLVNQLRLPAYLPELIVKPWTLATYMFTHVGFFHFLFNILGLYWFGRIFEDFLNGRQFVFTYLAGGLFGGLLYILAYNLLPGLRDDLPVATLLGASAAIMAILAAAATLVPDYTIFLFLIGPVRLKYLVLVYIAIDIISFSGMNAGGAISHLGGALLGYIFIKRLQAGSDWSKMFQRKPKLKVVQRNAVPVSSGYSSQADPDEEVIDRILDKISKSGYDSLSKLEKEQLFRASNKK